MTFRLTQKQLRASEILGSDARHVLLYGGSRSGKTFLLVRAVVLRALKHKTRHAILRFRFNHVKNSVVHDTLPKVMELCFPEVGMNAFDERGPTQPGRRSMKSTSIVAAFAAFAMLSSAAIAQSSGDASSQSAQSSTENQSSSQMSDSDRDARRRAQESAEKSGMTDIRILDRVFVLQGTTPQGETVFMIVNPPGALIGVGGPVNTGGANQGSSGSSGSSSSGNGSRLRVGLVWQLEWRSGG